MLILALSSLALLAYTSLRAYRLSFTHDESNSFQILLGNSNWRGTSADHRLNTRLMGVAYRWLGSREWQLRLPNVMAHVAYLAFGLLLLRRLQQWPAVLFGFAWLNLDPFLLDFFGLARGYGLASGLSMAALFFLWKAWQRHDLAGALLFSFLSLVCGGYAVHANYTWINLHLPLFAANLLLVLFGRDEGAFKVQPSRLFAAAMLTGLNGWYVYTVVRRLFFLRDINELGNRGEVGFIRDTIGSLIDTYFYMEPYSAGLKAGILVAIMGGFVFTVIVLGYRAWNETPVSFSTVLLIVLGLAIAAPIAEHYIFGIQYPNERIALYYIPLTGVLGMFFIDQCMTLGGRRTRTTIQVGSALLAGIMVVHLYRTANLHHTLTWFYDTNTKAAMLEIGRQFDNPGSKLINIGNTWLFEPTINYYRLTLPYKWLNPATRDRLLSDDNDVIYCYPADLDVHLSRYMVLQQYPETGTVLLKVNRGAE